MSRYFVHFSSADDAFEDIEGVELTDDAAACDYAVQDARYLMREGFAKPGEWPAWRVEVVDEAGRRLLALTFAEIEAPHRNVH